MQTLDRNTDSVEENGLIKRAIDEPGGKLNRNNYHVIQLTDDFWMFLQFIRFKDFTKWMLEKHNDEEKSTKRSLTSSLPFDNP